MAFVVKTVILLITNPPPPPPLLLCFQSCDIIKLGKKIQKKEKKQILVKFNTRKNNYLKNSHFSLKKNCWKNSVGLIFIFFGVPFFGAVQQTQNQLTHILHIHTSKHARAPTSILTAGSSELKSGFHCS